MSSFIPVSEPLLNGNEEKYLQECIRSGWISSEGPFVSRFEKLFSQKVGRRYGVSVCNGSAALEIAIKALGVGNGDEVIIPSFTIISCASAVIRAGAVPVLVDSDPKTWNMDVTKIEKKITSKTKAIMVVHIYGLPVDMDPVIQIAKKYKLKIIEDAAEAHGLTYKGKSCGSFGDISIFSFYSNKLVTTGEGGMVLTDDGILAQKAASLRNLCFIPEKRFVHEDLGWNMRMTNMQGALGCAQIERWDEFISMKRKIGKFYNRVLKDIKNIQLPLRHTNFAENIYWVYGVVLTDDYPHNADYVMQKLAQKGISTRPFFYPMHLQPVFKKMGLFRNEIYPISERLARKGFYLPCGLTLTEDQISRISNSMKEILS